MQKILKSTIFWLVICQALIIVVAVRNMLPPGYIFAGGDVVQYYNLAHITRYLNYTWSNLTGEGFFLQFFSYNLYYYIIYLFSALLHLSNSAQSFFYFFLFLTASFWSFYWGAKYFLQELSGNNFYLIGFALLYTFNFYTIYNFYYIWGYSPFLILYTLLPAIFGLSYRYFSIEKTSWPTLFMLAIPFFLSNIANGNMAFFIALNIFLVAFIVLCYIFLGPRLNFWGFVKKTVIYYLFFLLSVSFSVLPQIIEMLRQATAFSGGGTIFDLKAWILWQAVRFPDVLFLVYDLQSYFHTKIILGAGLFFALLVLIVYSNALAKSKMRNISLVFLVLLLIGFLMENKGVGIIGSGITLAIFSNTLLGALRSYDKVLIFIPFFIIILVFIQFQSSKYKKQLTTILVFLTLVFSYPFFVGGFQTKYSDTFKPGKNYLTSKSSFIHIIPEEYSKAANLLNQELLDSKLFSFPYNVLNSPGWVNFPKWKLIGVDPTVQLFNQPTIGINSYGAFGDWNYGELWNQQSKQDSLWLFPLSGYLNTRYFVYHKDVDQRFITKTLNKVLDLEKEGFLSRVSENDYFILYKIADRFYLPHVYTPEQVVISDKETKKLPSVINSFDTTKRSAIFMSLQNVGKDLTTMPLSIKEPPNIEYKKINPTKYRILIHRSTGAFPLVLSEAFHSGWKAYVVADQKPAANGDLAAKANNGYKIFEENSETQASKADLLDYINKGFVSNLGNGRQKEIVHNKWQNGKLVLDHSENYTVAFVSKNIQGTIQNDNLANGPISETWLKTPLSETSHFTVNGYANSWIIDPAKICSDDNKCIKNSDGTFDMELVVEFWPQRLFYLGLIISGSTLLGCIIGLIYYKRKSKKIKNAK